MSKSTNRWLRAGVASVATTALVASGLTAFAGAASASEPVDFERIAGDNRYETSVEAAEAFGNTQDAILASGETGHYVDALSANFLAGVTTAPILLTRHDQLPAPVKAHIESSNINEITIVGGELAVSASVEAELTAMGITVNRLEGQNRYRTNEAIIAAGAEEAADTALIATGINFPDALGAGPVSYAGKHPVGITKTEDIPDYVVDALLAAGVDKAVIVGGELAVSDEVETELESKGITVVTRLEGRNRAATSVAVAEFAVANLAGFDRGEMDFASGRELSEGIDALSGGPVSGREQTPILITVNEDRAPQLIDYLEENCAEVDDGDIYGGPLALSVALENQLEDAAQCDVTSNQDFTVTPAEAATNEVSTSATTNEGARQYSISGLDNATTYDVALFAAANVTVDDDGVVAFADTNNDNQADLTVDANGAVIEVVNGAAVGTPDNHIEVQPVNGTISFTVDSTTVDNVYPVLWVDATPGNANAVNLDANDQPTELFGVGGQKRFVAAEAGQGSPTADVAITDVDKDANVIYSTGARYEYDANDTYYVRGTDTDDATATTPTEAERVTFAEFEAQLSAGDELDRSTFYQPNPELPSTFVLEDIAPAAPTATTEDVNDTNVSFTVTGISSGATVTVYGGPDDDNAFNRTTDVQRGQTTTDQDPNTAGFQVIASGLTPSTAYDFFVTQTVSGEESGPSTRLDETTLAPADPAVITNAELVTDAPIEGRVGTGDEWLVEFDQDLAAGTVANSTFDLRDPDGDTIRVQCAAAAPTDFLTGATCTLVDGPDADTTADDALEITLLEPAEDRNADGNAGTTGGGISYPLTITAVTGLEDAENEDIDVANSTDVEIDDEA